MTTLLQINSSVFSDGGQSSQLANLYVEQWAKAHPDAKIIRRDLAKDPVPHLDGARVGALFTPPEQRSDEQKAVIAFSDALIAELQAADIIVLAVPMYNFSIPSQLKSYFDHIARAGITFRYTAEGAVGLLTGKKALIFAARGGYYVNTANDHQTALLRHFLGFLGITDVNFLYAEGLAISEQHKQDSMAQARKAVLELAV